MLLTEQELLLQQTVRDFAERELAPRAAELDERDEADWGYFRRFADLGLLGITVPPELGGNGLGFRAVAIAVEEIARADPGTSTNFISHLSLSTYAINQFASQALRARLVPPLARGEKIAAFALTEPGSGSDAAALATTARKTKGGYILNGSKIFITNASVADYIVTFVTQDKALGHRGILALVVEKGTKGLRTQKMHGKMGMRSSDTAEVYLEDVFVPEGNRMGEEGQGFRIAMETLNSSRISIASQCVGIAQAAYEAALKYTQERRAFGGPIAQLQAVQHMLADMATETEASRLLVWKAATLKDGGLPFVKEASMAKLFASETAVRVADKAVQLHGGYGYFKPSVVERLYRDAKVTTIYEGTSQVQRLVIARQVLQSG
ncbi:MAG: acyl-CoA dehydrogenase family protein [Chloroflexi bacterium]|nr:acyl-CoA dehydrogenase family protein [Chloroflexota bacterium]